jgi:hypothetical protein
VHFLDYQLDFFPENIEAMSDKHEKRFRQAISAVEKLYEGKWSPSILAGYCRTLGGDGPQAKYSRKLPTVTFLVMYILSLM